METRFPRLQRVDKSGTERLLTLTADGYTEIRKTTVKKPNHRDWTIVSNTGRLAKFSGLNRKTPRESAIEIYGIDRRLEASIPWTTALSWIDSKSLPQSPEIQFDDFDAEEILSILKDRVYQADAFTRPK